MRIAVLGLGFMGSTHLKALLHVSGATLAAVVSSDEGKLSGDLSGIQGNLGGPGEKMDFSGVARYHTVEEAHMSKLTDNRNFSLDLSTEEIGLYTNVLNEILNGLEVRDFPAQVSISRGRAELLLQEFNEGYKSSSRAEKQKMHISAEEARVLRNAFSTCIQELGEEEMSVRTGFTIPEAKRHVRTLDNLLGDLPIGNS
jgi:hypothetical protein